MPADRWAHRVPVVLCLVLVGCTVEPRPPQGDEGGQEVEDVEMGESPVPESGAGAASAGSEAARAFLASFQDARSRGALEEVRSHLHENAVVSDGGRLLEWRVDPDGADGGVAETGGGPGADGEVAESGDLLVPEAGVRGWRIDDERAAAYPPGILYHLEYPAPSDGASVQGPSFSETILLAPDTLGWTVRLLDRSYGPPAADGS